MLDLSERLDQARRETDALFATVKPEFLYERPVPERHRLIFYVGHVDTFDWNHVGRFSLGEPDFHPTFGTLFEAGIDPVAGKGPTDQPADWPKLEEIKQYARECRRRVDELTLRAPDGIVEMVIEHRLMHVETLSYLLHAMPHEQKIPVPQASAPDSPDSPRSDGLVEVTGGLVGLGKSRGEGFGWDNEFDKFYVRVPGFRIDRFKVTNGDYLKFVDDGGSAPHFWIRQNRGWNLRNMFEDVPLPLDWPVYVTQDEASEYAQWRGAKLPTEAQFHRAAYGARTGEELSYPWGEEDPSTVAGNFGLRRFDPVPVDADPESNSAFGISQLAGNGWEWTSSPFEAFPGFKPLPTYPGYSQNFFDGHHFVLKGASPRTANCFLRRSFRNWFRPDYPYAYATFRCVES